MLALIDAASSLSDLLRMPVFDRKCPACAGGFGDTQVISTASGRPNVLAIVMKCDSCAHAWTVEPLQSRNPERPPGAQEPTRVSRLAGASDS